jgi:hypothetical protein
VKTIVKRMKILMLVLASDTEDIHIAFQSTWRKYMKSHPNVDCYFYKAHPLLPDAYILRDDTLWIRAGEGYRNVYNKTFEAFKYFEKDLHKYDFVFRPNLSSFVVMDKYVQYCSTLPKQRLVAGGIGVYEGILFPSGCGFTMSSDVVMELIRDNPPYVYLDDVTIGKWLQTKSIPIQPAPRGDYSNDSMIFTTSWPVEQIFHFRVRNRDRKLDIEIHKKLLQQYYGLTTP